MSSCVKWVTLETDTVPYLSLGMSAAPISKQTAITWGTQKHPASSSHILDCHKYLFLATEFGSNLLFSSS